MNINDSEKEHLYCKELSYCIVEHITECRLRNLTINTLRQKSQISLRAIIQNVYTLEHQTLTINSMSLTDR